MNKKRGWTGIVVLISIMIGLSVQAAPVITAKDGILYRDGKPYFLVGVWSEAGYYGFSVHPQSPATLEFVPGHEGKGLKISFGPKMSGSRWVDFPGFDSRLCVDNKARFLKLWVKGDGSSNAVTFKVENYVGKVIASAHLGEFTLASTNWTQFSFPLEKNYPVLAQANGACLILLSGKGTPEGLSFIIDDITMEGPSGEIVIGDFDKKMPVNNVYWSNRNMRDKFKDDPVYQALWNDPLYQEISRKNFETIGMNTFHLACVSERYEDPVNLLKGADQGSFGEAILCKKLDGMPMVPGFVFDWGAYNSDKAEKWAQSLGLPMSILQRAPNGRPVGSYMAICFEDPLGNKLFKTVWQKAARRLLSHGANIYAYELINENSGFYRCGCAINQAEFIRRMRAKYGDIATLNKDWGADYPGFEAVQAQIPKLGNGDNKIKGLSIEWNKFLEDRYVEMLHQGGEWIHEVEDELGKPHALMSQMGYPHWDMIGSGGSYMYKMAKGLDCIQTEAGIKLGSSAYSGEVNPLTDVWTSKGTYGHQMALDLADAACPDKPIINTEHSMQRCRGNLTEPVTKSDVITSLWEEFIRGASAVHTYYWGVRYASREEALADGQNRCLLSPYVYPRESLNGYKEVQEEIGRVADVVMERPRLGRDAETAVLFSRPTARYLVGVPSWFSNWKEKHPFYRSHETMYKYLLENHYPFRYLYEEELVKSAGRYRLILAPHSDNIYPETFRLLEDFVKKGGTLVCFGDALRYDEYGNEKDLERSSLLGLERKKAESIVDLAELKGIGSIKVKHNRQITLTTAKALAVFSETGSPFVTVNQAGKGNVYYINADVFLNETNLVPVFDFVARQVNLHALVEVVDQEGVKVPGIEAYQIPKGDKRVLFLVNQVPYRDVVAKIRLKGITESVEKVPEKTATIRSTSSGQVKRGPPSPWKTACFQQWRDALRRVRSAFAISSPDRDKYHLVDIVRNSVYLKDGQATITVRELQEGINIFLPNQERVVLLLTRDDYQTPNPPQKLLDDAAALEMDRKVKKEIKAAADREAQEALVSRETILGIKNFAAGGSNCFEQIKKSALAAAGAGLAEVQLLDADNSWKVKNFYGLREGADSVFKCRFVYKETLSKETIDKVHADVLDALFKQYGDKLKIISGWKEADILKIRENMLKAGEYKATGACLPLDIRKQANMGFKDEKADDQKGGLFDEGRSLKGLPVGSNTFAGIVFDIINPEKNNGSACIVLRGKAKPYFPEKAEGVTVGRKAKNIYLLHGACYCARDSQEVVYRLKFNYADNMDAYADIKAGSEIADWFSKSEDILANARSGWMGKAMESSGEELGVILYCARIANPKPEKEIRTLDIISANNAAVPAIFAVTVEDNKK